MNPKFPVDTTKRISIKNHLSLIKIECEQMTSSFTSIHSVGVELKKSDLTSSCLAVIMSTFRSEVV